MFYVDTEFGKWLLCELEKRGWSQNELGRRAGLTSGTISNAINGVRTPTNDTLKSIARALKVPKETVFREAGVLPSVPDRTEQQVLLIHLFESMTDQQREMLISQARWILSTRD